ncbi:aminoglycoside phosphotransferase family protein [Actinomadura sp. KC216]|uniref:aminoglycoside phosphotransferase family protein n=1 Tax=Actinomadura sp. KC216 TaxID=2530370 RepID=UPI0010449929|nr:phosphotransferase [Actinomadura sp. KC216]TDB83685.1 aminoglycoside phosphotransferase family protein [Actinomadura sp. KC216]
MPGQEYDRVKDLNHTNPTRRDGRMVRHPAQAWTSTVHAFLRHLEDEGFPAAPRVVGSGFDDAGNEVLTWLDGDIFARSVWPDPEQSMHDVGAMLRSLHEASRTFTPPPDARWMPWTLHTDAPDALISHGNVAPWHVVFRDGRPGGLIGWEYAGPVDPIEEVAVTGWYCAQLFDDDVAEEIGLPDAATRAGWFASFLDGYGLAHDHRADLIDRILHFVIRDNGWYARVQGFTPESTEGMWTLAWQSRAALWTLEHRELLTRTALR